MSFTVFLGNLPTWVTADDIQSWLNAEALVADSIKVIRNPETQESKGFAFIEAPNAEEMQAIIRRFDRAPLEDKLLRANPAQPPKGKGLPVRAGAPGERPAGDRPPERRPYGSRPPGDRPYGDRPYGDRPQGERSYGDRTYGDRTGSSTGANTGSNTGSNTGASMTAGSTTGANVGAGAAGTANNNPASAGAASASTANTTTNAGGAAQSGAANPAAGAGPAGDRNRPTANASRESRDRDRDKRRSTRSGGTSAFAEELAKAL